MRSQQIHDVARDALFDVDLDVLVLRFAHEAGDVVEQGLGDGGDAGRQAHLAANAAAKRGHVAVDARERELQAARVLQQGLAGRRGPRALSPAQQQGLADGVFQLRQALADGGGLDVLLRGGGLDVAVVAHRHEQAQALQVQVSHGFRLGMYRLPRLHLKSMWEAKTL